MAQRKLDKKKLDYYRKLLNKLKDVCSGDISSLASNPRDGNSESSDISGHVMHIADVATDMYDREFNLGLVSNERELMNKINKALEKIDNGTFGQCEECKGSIPEVRLKAIPYVDNCRKCQEKIEQEA